MGEFQYFLTLFGKFTFGIIYASFYIFVSFYKFLLLPLLLLLLLSLFLPSASLQKASIVVMPLFNCFKRFSFAFGTAPAPWRRPASAGCCTRHGPRPRTAATPPLCAPSRTAHRLTTGRRASARGEQTSQPVWPPAQPGLVVGFPPSLTPHTCTRGAHARTHPRMCAHALSEIKIAFVPLVYVQMSGCLNIGSSSGALLLRILCVLPVHTVYRNSLFFSQRSTLLGLASSSFLGCSACAWSIIL